jgi:hypothetical protein
VGRYHCGLIVTLVGKPTAYIFLIEADVLQAMTLDVEITIWTRERLTHIQDAFALLLASYHPALELIGVSTVYGNASLERTTKNALSVLDAIGKSEICVYPGQSKPFCREAKHAPDIHGLN